MHTSPKHRYRSAIPVKSGILYELVVQRGMDAFQNLEVVVDLDNLFPSVAERAVTSQ